MRQIIAPTTAGDTSDTFRVGKGEIISIVAKGLAGTEKAQIQIANGDGTFSDITESTATLTVTSHHRTIAATGDYRVVLVATVGNASVAIGE